MASEAEAQVFFSALAQHILHFMSISEQRRHWRRNLAVGKALGGKAVAQVTQRVEVPTLIVLVILAAGLWGFVNLAGEVLEGDTHGFDAMILTALRNPVDLGDPIGPPWFEETARDFTALGGVGVLSFLTLAVAGWLWMRGNRRSMWLVLLSTGSGYLVGNLLKRGFDRPRPDLVPHEAVVYTASFPSNHSMMSAVVYLTLAALVARVEPNRKVKAYLIGVAILLAVLVGASRVYLGVHWPTDVAAGWTMGAIWALAWWLCARWLETRGMVEPERDDGAS
ncbi:phosphatase PAP2 family protein [Consotaella aegiceratis]|uniref:phosphatase PAP2 family protein n=1 Tax=Consotaella aegiceratis TaxID=3097961 RepID=UPI002F3F7A25